MKKLLILLIIATLLVPIPLAAANSRPSLNKIVFIYRDGFAKPSGTLSKVSSGGEKECYEFLGMGVKWKDLPVNYIIDPDNPDGLSESFVVDAMSSGAEEWDTYTGAELFGNYTIANNATFDTDSPDGRNELLFGNYTEAGVIAVAIVWGIFIGPPQIREIIEFDIMFDTDFTWGYAGPTNETNLGDTTVMDLQNIATHEIGHGAGLADLYDAQCSEQTMYGYATNGETKKRTLNTGDITGIQTLYGPTDHDVAVVGVVPAKTATFTTLSVLNVSVTVKNNGSTSETFDVKAYYKNVTATYEIGTLTVANLAGGAEESLTFGWNLSNVAWGFYNISAEAFLDGDINPTDNTLLNGAVHIMVPGDADGNGFVELADFPIWVEYLGKHEGEWPSDVYPDFDSSGFVELTDFPVWVDHIGKEE